MFVDGVLEEFAPNEAYIKASLVQKCIVHTPTAMIVCNCAEIWEKLGYVSTFSYFSQIFKGFWRLVFQNWLFPKTTKPVLSFP